MSSGILREENGIAMNGPTPQQVSGAAMHGALQKEDIAAVLRSMALSGSKGSFIPGKELRPGSMDVEARRFHAGWAADFFGLPPAVAEDLLPFADWDDWAALLLERLPVSGPEAFRFRTSGSTGTPVVHSLSRADFAEETASLLPYFTSRRRVVSVMPVHHVFGFVFALLLPKALGIPSVFLPPLPTMRFFNSLQSGDLLLAFPVFWKSLLSISQEAGSAVFPPALEGVSSSAPCPPEVIEGLLDRYLPGPLEGMIEIYGATEFGAVGIRNRCREPYTLLPHWTRTRLENGRGGADAAEPFSFGICRKSAGPQPLPDIAEWLDERRFFPVKRKDFAVQVGGENVFPAEIAAALCEHPQVKEAAVRLMRQEEGHRLKAFIVPSDPADLKAPQALIREIKLWSSQKLKVTATPKHFRLGAALPLTAAGKQADWNILEDTADALNFVMEENE